MNLIRVIEIVDAGVGDFKVNLAAGGESRVGEIFYDFVLRVDGDGFSAGEVREIDAMRAAAETQIDSVVHQAFALQAFAHAGFFQQVYRALFENTGAHALLHVLAAAIFENDGFDAVEMQQMREHQACGPGADDANLRAHDGADLELCSVQR